MQTRSVTILGISLVLTLIGLWLLVQSPSLARAAADGLTRSSGGALDTNTYLATLSASAAAYRLLGGVLLGVGLVRALWLPLRSE